jgi:hypothetical protein
MRLVTCSGEWTDVLVNTNSPKPRGHQDMQSSSNTKSSAPKPHSCSSTSTRGQHGSWYARAHHCHGDISATSFGPRRIVPYQAISTINYVFLLLTLWCFTWVSVSSQQCTPCPTGCNCLQLSSSPNVECALDCSNTGLSVLPEQINVPPLDAIVSM